MVQSVTVDFFQTSVFKMVEKIKLFFSIKNLYFSNFQHKNHKHFYEKKILLKHLRQSPFLLYSFCQKLKKTLKHIQSVVLWPCFTNQRETICFIKISVCNIRKLFPIVYVLIKNEMWNSEFKVSWRKKLLLVEQFSTKSFWNIYIYHIITFKIKKKLCHSDSRVSDFTFHISMWRSLLSNTHL